MDDADRTTSDQVLMLLTSACTFQERFRLAACHSPIEQRICCRPTAKPIETGPLWPPTSARSPWKLGDHQLVLFDRIVQERAAFS